MKKIISIITLLAILASCLSVGVAAANTDVAAIGATTYPTLQEAIAAYSDPSTCIQLVADTSEPINVTKDVYLDLNGHNVTGNVTVSGGTLYCMDSQTDDYTIKDEAGYGSITNADGIVAVPEEAICAEDGYLMIEEDNTLSFHRVNLQITSMVLRAEDASVYYRSQFAGDEMVADQVESFGIALSVQEIPNKDNLDEKCKRSTFTSFEAGSNCNNSTSTLLKNIIKPTNADLRNNANSKIKIYGRAYLQTLGGDYLFGAAKTRTFCQQVQAAAEDAIWSKLEENQKDSMIAMYRQYTSMLRSWGISNVESALVLDKKDPLTTKEDDSLKVLAITSSFGLNTTQLLYDVAVAEGYDPEKVTVARLYASGCTLEKHLAHAPDKGLYQYSKVTGDPSKTSTPGVMQTLIKEKNTDTGEPGATLLHGLQDEDWDIIFMQQGAAQAPQLNTYLDSKGNDRITLLRNIVNQYKTNSDARFVWNMLWGYQSDSTVDPFPRLFNSDQLYMYQRNIDAVMRYVIPRTDYDRIIPTGTAIQNARSSEFGDNLCRDTYHLNNYGAIIAAYGLFAVITGQEITEVNIDAVAVSAKNGIGGAAKITTPLTATQKAIIMESVNNALNDPFKVTESQYPPVEQSYTANLKFIGDSKVAVCPACRTEATWTEIEVDSNGAPTNTTLFGTPMYGGTYHFYLSSDVTYTGSTNPFIYINASSAATGGQRKVCLHLNSHNLTATKNTVATIGANGILNIMGQGTVSGNGTLTNRGSTIVVNSGASNTSGFGAIRLYSGTYVQTAGSTVLAPVSTGPQGGLLEIYEDVRIEGNTNSLWINATNNNNSSANRYIETVNIYGGTFTKPVYCQPSGIVTTTSTLNISGGKFNEGITLDSNTMATLSGNPVITGAGLKLAEGLTVTLSELTKDASIAVDATGAFTVANTKAANYLTYFSPVKSGYSINAKDNILYCEQN